MSCKNLTLFYTGVTNDLIRRVYEHKNKLVAKSYTSRYNLDRLVYYEEVTDPLMAIEREKQIKKYGQKKKLNLIQKMNTGVYDLYDSLTNT